MVTGKVHFNAAVDSNSRRLQDSPAYRGLFGAGIAQTSTSFTVGVPYWFLILAAVAMAATPWLLSCRRFSLRTLLIATTLVAVVLGLVVWLSNH